MDFEVESKNLTGYIHEKKNLANLDSRPSLTTEYWVLRIIQGIKSPWDNNFSDSEIRIHSFIFIWLKHYKYIKFSWKTVTLFLTQNHISYSVSEASRELEFSIHLNFATCKYRGRGFWSICHLYHLTQFWNQRAEILHIDFTSNCKKNFQGDLEILLLDCVTRSSGCTKYNGRV